MSLIVYSQNKYFSAALFWNRFYLKVIRTDIPKSLKEWEVKKLENLKERQEIPKANSKLMERLKLSAYAKL